MLLATSLEETQRADRSAVASPAEWLAWSVRIGLEPLWLKAAYGDKRLVPMLPLDLQPHRELARGAGSLADTARAGGKRRHEVSEAGRAKKLLLPQIRQWLNESTGETAKAFAERLQDRLDRLDRQLHGKGCWAEIAVRRQVIWDI